MMIMWILPVLLVIGLVAPREGDRSALVWAIGLLAALPLGAAAMMGGFGFTGMMGYGYGGWNWISMTATLLTTAGLGILAYFLIKRIRPIETEEERILQLRLAKGEITAEEYDRLRQKLQVR